MQGNHKNFGLYLRKFFQPKKCLINLAQHSISKENKQQITLPLQTSSCDIFCLRCKETEISSNVIKDYVWGKPVVTEIVGNGGAMFKFKHVNEKEIYDELKNLKRKKAQGLDDFPPGLLKDGASLIAKPLSYIINMSLSEGVIPTEWKAAKVTPLHKSGSSAELRTIDRSLFSLHFRKFLSVLFTGSC
eukprot:Seg932.3 transcript_id=Seg932.3/GoldUCD/mRNA.D3Y31 product="hypothetical protein" protein_id=Seg932.3/GoldUCD/D3Y31